MDISDADFMLALQLQEEFNQESKNDFLTNTSKEIVKTSIVDQFWELNDPNPDIRGLFLEFNASYFWNRLQGVEVRWSSRMTLCAGVCCYEGRGGLCSVRLSLPLLKLRPRKDLVETLLHEMIHAYLFVTHNNRDHNSHGPEFLKHMHRINELTGAKITVRHNFHDEVNEYRQHWWRCNGSCRHRPPYYGIIRRAMNRAPSANDFWWEEHKISCGGTYEKIKEPEGNNSKRKGTSMSAGAEKKTKSENLNMKTFFPVLDENLPSQKAISSVQNMDISVFENKKSSSNIHCLESPSKTPKHFNVTPFSGKGHVLGSSPLQNSNDFNKKSSLHFYFESNKDAPNRLLSSCETSKFRNKKGLLKKQSGSSRELQTIPGSVSPRNAQERTHVQNFKTPSKISETWLNASNTIMSPMVKGNSKKPFMPPRKLSTASPLNHVKKILMASDIINDDSDKKHTSTTSFTLASNTPVQEKSSDSSESSHESPVMLQRDCLNSTNKDVQESIVVCPVCNQKIQNSDINNHLDLCLSC